MSSAKKLQSVTGNNIYSGLWTSLVHFTKNLWRKITQNTYCSGYC